VPSNETVIIDDEMTVAIPIIGEIPVAVNPIIYDQSFEYDEVRVRNYNFLTVATNDTASKIVVEMLTPYGYEYYDMETSDNSIWTSVIYTNEIGEHNVTRYIVTRDGEVTAEAGTVGYIGVPAGIEEEPEYPPITDFVASSTSGNAALTVVFSDISQNSPTSWLWDFGDGETSTEQFPTHVYTSAGTYTVTLIAKNDIGSDTEIKEDYIKVSRELAGRSKLVIPSTQNVTSYSYDSTSLTVTNSTELYDNVMNNISSGYLLASLLVMAIALGAIMKYFGIL
jgi:PKD repeat protein